MVTATSPTSSPPTTSMSPPSTDKPLPLLAPQSFGDTDLQSPSPSPSRSERRATAPEPVMTAPHSTTNGSVSPPKASSSPTSPTHHHHFQYPSHPQSANSSLAYRPRTQSPLARSGHVRSHSGNSLLRAPQMTRAHSSPMPDSSGRLAPRRPASPLNSYGRHRSPFRRPVDEGFSSFGTDLDIDQTIAEHAELEVTPRGGIPAPSPIYVSQYQFTSGSGASLEVFPSNSASTSPVHSTHSAAAASRSTRRRPASPSSSYNSIFSPAPPPPPPHFFQAGYTSPPAPPLTPRNGDTTRLERGQGYLRPSTSSPSLSMAGFNESYPSTYTTVSSSSTSTSTPSSIRSRSPSMSSLETIPDIPDAEQEAEKSSAVLMDSEGSPRSVSYLASASGFTSGAHQQEDNLPRGRTSSLSSAISRGSAKDKRSRWSVCGAERRGDLNLETIWEA